MIALNRIQRQQLTHAARALLLITSAVVLLTPKDFAPLLSASAFVTSSAPAEAAPVRPVS